MSAEPVNLFETDDDRQAEKRRQARRKAKYGAGMAEVLALAKEWKRHQRLIAKHKKEADKCFQDMKAWINKNPRKVPRDIKRMLEALSEMEAML